MKASINQSVDGRQHCVSPLLERYTPSRPSLVCVCAGKIQMSCFVQTVDSSPPSFVLLREFHTDTGSSLSACGFFLVRPRIHLNLDVSQTKKKKQIQNKNLLFVLKKKKGKRKKKRAKSRRSCETEHTLSSSRGSFQPRC